MSKYTTGEMAKLCGVSVRTVQYYDSRGILIPSELTEGGRRLYSEEDLQKLNIICFLRELDLPINSIGELLAEEKPETVISILLEEQEKALRKEIQEKQARLDKVEELRRMIGKAEHFTVESIGDIAHIMENRKKLRRTRAVLVAVGLLMDIIEVGTLVLWIGKGIWMPFALGMCVVLALGIAVSVFYYRRTVYICPQCHAVFRPAFRQAFWSGHTPSMRKLTCTACGYRGFCVETYGREGEKNG